MSVPNSQIKLGKWYRTRSGKVGQLTSVSDLEDGKLGGVVQITDQEHVVVPDLRTLRPVNPPSKPNRDIPGRDF